MELLVVFGKRKDDPEGDYPLTVIAAEEATSYTDDNVKLDTEERDAIQSGQYKTVRRIAIQVPDEEVEAALRKRKPNTDDYILGHTA